MSVLDWKKEAEKLRFDEGKSWSEVSRELKHNFPDLTLIQVQDKVRRYIRSTPRYKEEINVNREQSAIEYKSDGSIISQKFITIRDGEDMSPDFLLEAHGLSITDWEVISYKNNFWNTQVKGGAKQISYQSKLTAKPTKQKITETDIDNYFNTKQFKYDKPLTKAIQYDIKGEVLEICIPDLHNGLLAWRMETGNDYDIKIAKDYFFKCIYDIINRCKHRKFKKIYFVTLGDLLHFDNDEQRTTKGTFQQADGRLSKIFDATLDMLIDAITLLGDIAPVEVIYLSGNHDRLLGYTVLKGVEKAFRFDKNITFDTTQNPQKFRLIGINLIGWTHGDMPTKNMANWLQHRAKVEYGKSKFAEVHAGHIHSTKTVEAKRDFIQTEDVGGIVIRYLPTICNSSYWEHQQGYANAGKILMSFIWNEKTGLREMWYSNI